MLFVLFFVITKNQRTFDTLFDKSYGKMIKNSALQASWFNTINLCRILLFLFPDPLKDNKKFRLFVFSNIRVFLLPSQNVQKTKQCVYFVQLIALK